LNSVSNSVSPKGNSKQNSKQNVLPNSIPATLWRAHTRTRKAPTRFAHPKDDKRVERVCLRVDQERQSSMSSLCSCFAVARQSRAVKQQTPRTIKNSTFLMRLSFPRVLVWSLFSNSVSNSVSSSVSSSVSPKGNSKRNSKRNWKRNSKRNWKRNVLHAFLYGQNPTQSMLVRRTCPTMHVRLSMLSMRL